MEYAASPGESSASPSAAISAGSMPSAIPISWSPNEAGLPRAAAGQGRRPAAEQPEVARADRPARTGQQGEQRGVGGDVVEQVQRRHHLGDLGQPDQPGEADDLHGHVARGERVEDVGGVRVVAGEHADVGPLRPGLVDGLDLVGQPGQLVGLRRQDPRRDLPHTGVGLGAPGGRPGRRTSRRAAAASRLATSRMRRSERRLTVSGKVSPRVWDAPKVSAKCRMLDTDAPRQP